jgi:ABC-type antimicrobial peptide transport system permease subunit
MRFGDYVAMAFRSLRRSRMRSGLTISAIVIGATGITIMLTFVTSVKNYIVNQFVQSGQVRQIAVAQNPDLTYDPAGGGGGGIAPSPGGGSSGPVSLMTPALETKIAAIPHVTAISAMLQDGGGGGGIEYLSLGSKRLQANFFGYEPNGVIEPPLIAGRDLRSSDKAGVMLVSQDYADALGYKSAYAKLVGKTVQLHTRIGYTGAGATLPDVLPAQRPCAPDQHGPNVCGPMSGLPAIALPARVVGVVSKEFHGQTTFIPLSWLLGMANDAQPRDVRYAQQSNGSQQCGPNQPCQQCAPNQPCRPQPRQQQCAPNQCPQPSGGPQCQPGQPCGQQGPGTVIGGWTRQSISALIANRGGYQSMIAQVDTLANVAGVASSIDRLGVNAATGLDALNERKQKANVLGAVLGALGLIALGIAALGVMNTMVMSVLERTREIGVMRALGAGRSTIRRLFSFEAAGLGFFGGLFGVLLGYGIVLGAKPIISRAVKSSSQAGAPNFSVPVWLIAMVTIGTTLIGFLSGFLPARRAARLDPVEALRYE